MCVPSFVRKIDLEGACGLFFGERGNELPGGGLGPTEWDPGLRLGLALHQAGRRVWFP